MKIVSNLLENIEGIQIYYIIGLLIFFTLFVVIFIRTMRRSDNEMEEIKNSIPMVLVIEKDNEYVKYINDEDAIELLELYIESKNIEMSKGEKKDFIETNLLLQKKVTVNTRGYNVHIEYMTGRKEDITIIAKRLDFNPIYDDMKIVEFIPKEVITNTDEISFLFEDYEIINKFRGTQLKVENFLSRVTSDVSAIQYIYINALFFWFQKFKNE